MAFPLGLRAQLSPERDRAGTGVPWNLVQTVSWWDGGRGLGRKEEKREVRRERARGREVQDAAVFPRSLRKDGAGGRSLEPSADGGLGGGCPQIGRASLWDTAAPTHNGPGTHFYPILHPAEKPSPSDPWLVWSLVRPAGPPT